MWNFVLCLSCCSKFDVWLKMAKVPSRKSHCFSFLIALYWNVKQMCEFSHIFFLMRGRQQNNVPYPHYFYYFIIFCYNIFTFHDRSDWRRCGRWQHFHHFCCVVRLVNKWWLDNKELFSSLELQLVSEVPLASVHLVLQWYVIFIVLRNQEKFWRMKPYLLLHFSCFLNF